MEVFVLLAVSVADDIANSCAVTLLHFHLERPGKVFYARITRLKSIDDLEAVGVCAAIFGHSSEETWS